MVGFPLFFGSFMGVASSLPDGAWKMSPVAPIESTDLKRCPDDDDDDDDGGGGGGGDDGNNFWWFTYSGDEWLLMFVHGHHTEDVTSLFRIFCRLA